VWGAKITSGTIGKWRGPVDSEEALGGVCTAAGEELATHLSLAKPSVSLIRGSLEAGTDRDAMSALYGYDEQAS
jgi:hypothetical protein